MSGVLLQQTDLSQLWLTTRKFMKRLTIQNSNKQQATKQGPTRNVGWLFGKTRLLSNCPVCIL